MAKHVPFPRFSRPATAVARCSAIRFSLLSIAFIAALMATAATRPQPETPSGNRIVVHRATVAGQDDAYARLRAFARAIGIEAAPSSPHGDDASSALLDSDRAVGIDPDRSIMAQAAAAKPAPTSTFPPATPAKPAAANPAAAKPAASKPAPAKKSSSAKPENKGGDGDAYFFSSAECAECRAAITAEFSSTLMGRKDRTTRKGTMECENCHDLGSKHVAAGGGQNKGMIAYRPGDPCDNIEELNEICLTCHQRGNQMAWNGSTQKTRGVACTQCHTVIRNVSTNNLLLAGTEI